MLMLITWNSIVERKKQVTNQQFTKFRKGFKREKKMNHIYWHNIFVDVFCAKEDGEGEAVVGGWFFR